MSLDRVAPLTQAAVRESSSCVPVSLVTTDHYFGPRCLMVVCHAGGKPWTSGQVPQLCPGGQHGQNILSQCMQFLYHGNGMYLNTVIVLSFQFRNGLK